jgi:hypothetical protein
MPLDEYRALEGAIAASHPRFNTEPRLDSRSFPAGLIFSFLETFVARLTRAQADFSVDGSIAEESLDDLIKAAAADDVELACCRVVSHMTTANGQAIDFSNVRVEPVISEAAGHRAELQKVISATIPGASSAYGRVDPEVFAPPESVVVARDHSPQPSELHEPLSLRIERFMLLVRLLKPGTSESVLEIRGDTHPVRDFKPSLVRFRGAGPSFASPTQLAARVIELDPNDVARIDGLDRLFKEAQRENSGMIFTSFGMAIQRFIASFHAYSWHEQIVDLTTALEATLSGTAKHDITLRLKTRAANLLSTDRDPPGNIFNDVDVIYGLRSTLVHGGAMKRAKLLADVKKLSTAPDDVFDGVAIAHAVERLRDLVRRSLLARICLATGDSPLWPLDRDSGVDIVMVDDSRREVWRSAWLDTLRRIDALASADRPHHGPAQI